MKEKEEEGKVEERGGKKGGWETDFRTGWMAGGRQVMGKRKVRKAGKRAAKEEFRS